MTPTKPMTAEMAQDWIDLPECQPPSYEKDVSEQNDFIEAMRAIASSQHVVIEAVELERLRKDAARIDFMERTGQTVYRVTTKVGPGGNDYRFDGYSCDVFVEPSPTIREAIDAAAIAKEGKNG